MRAVEIIRKKRQGGELTAAEIGFFVREYAAERIQWIKDNVRKP